MQNFNGCIFVLALAMRGSARDDDESSESSGSWGEDEDGGGGGGPVSTKEMGR